jgi:hypothetical protein
METGRKVSWTNVEWKESDEEKWKGGRGASREGQLT